MKPSPTPQSPPPCVAATPGEDGSSASYWCLSILHQTHPSYQYTHLGTWVTCGYVRVDCKFLKPHIFLLPQQPHRQAVRTTQVTRVPGWWGWSLLQVLLLAPLWLWPSETQIYQCNLLMLFACVLHLWPLIKALAHRYSLFFGSSPAWLSPILGSSSHMAAISRTFECKKLWRGRNLSLPSMFFQLV